MTTETHMIDIKARNRFLEVKIIMMNEKPMDIRVPCTTFFIRLASWGM